MVGGQVMIIHCVFCNMRGDVSAAARVGIFEELKAFSEGLEGMLGFEHGPNRDFERKSQDYSDGFVMRFADAAALQAYAVHPTHQALGARLCEMCKDGGDGITVFDIEAG